MNTGEKYPSKPILKFFRTCDITKGDNLEMFLATLETEWWASNWGFKRTKRKGKIRLQLHTGGWSGNEDIIEALQHNFMFWMWWRKSIVGGHYWFEITPFKDLPQK